MGMPTNRRRLLSWTAARMPPALYARDIWRGRGGGGGVKCSLVRVKCSLVGVKCSLIGGVLSGVGACRLGTRVQERYTLKLTVWISDTTTDVRGTVLWDCTWLLPTVMRESSWP
eukprot:7180797-Pyramimonas_sp.AAC.1